MHKRRRAFSRGSSGIGALITLLIIGAGIFGLYVVIAAVTSSKTDFSTWTIGCPVPGGYIQLGYGEHPYDEVPLGFVSEGVDVAAPTGSLVQAVDDGVVLVTADGVGQPQFADLPPLTTDWEKDKIKFAKHLTTLEENDPLLGRKNLHRYIIVVHDLIGGPTPAPSPKVTASTNPKTTPSASPSPTPTPPYMARYYIYAQLNNARVKVNDTVHRGDQIATVGTIVGGPLGGPLQTYITLKVYEASNKSPDAGSPIDPAPFMKPPCLTPPSPNRSPGVVPTKPPRFLLKISTIKSYRHAELTTCHHPHDLSSEAFS